MDLNQSFFYINLLVDFNLYNEYILYIAFIPYILQIGGYYLFYFLNKIR